MIDRGASYRAFAATTNDALYWAVGATRVWRREGRKRPPQARRIGNLQGHAMPLFACSGYRVYPDVEAGNAREAARFLRAKSEYGAGGQCTFLAATAGSVLTFQAFIGNYRGPGITDDRKVTITVDQQEN